MNRRYTVVLTQEPDDGSWIVRVPALPGCYSSGGSIDEGIANAKEAIAQHLSVLEELGEAAPAGDTSVTASVEVA